MHSTPTHSWGYCSVGCVLSAVVLSGLLLHSHASAQEPFPTTGITIFVHGFTPRDGKTNPPFDYWGGDRGKNFAALLNRFGSGLVWLYDPATGNYQNITHSKTESGAYRIPHDGWTPAFAGEQILLFDWTDGSDEKEAGQAEAAADALFASLMEFEVNGERIITSSPYAATRPLHFVGHSRGTVVVSETVQRLGRFNIQVDYVTYLDIHDFGQDLIPNDEFFHDPAVQVWDNITYADAFYQEHPANVPVSCFPNPSGRPLPHFNSTVLQRDVTDYTTPDDRLDCDAANRPHSWVKNYYWDTVDPEGFSNYGFNRWFAQGGYGQPRDESITRVRSVVGEDAEEFVWARDLANDRSFWDRNDVPPILFNGDFELPDLDRGIGGLRPEANSLAGWYYFGGGGSADIHPELLQRDPGETIVNSYLALQGAALQARHNRFYLPVTAREIRFALSVPFVPVTPLQDHTLEVSIGNRLLRRFTVAKTDDFEVRTVDLRNHPDLLGGVNTLTFRLVTVAGTSGLTARAHIDNVSIVADSVGWLDSIAQQPDGDLLVRWQSWPAGTFFLEARTSLTGDTWQPAMQSPTASTAGTFTIPVDPNGNRYYRGRIISAR